MICVPIVEDSLVLVCGKTHEFYQKDTVYASELEGRRFAMREKGSGTRKLFEQYLSAHDIHIQTVWEANCPRTIMNAVIYNNVLAVISQRLVKHECMHRAVKVFRYETGEWDRHFKLVYRIQEAALSENMLSQGIRILESALGDYRTLSLPQDIPTCVFISDVGKKIAG